MAKKCKFYIKNDIIEGELGYAKLLQPVREIKHSRKGERKMTEQELKILLQGKETRTLEYKRAWTDIPNNLYDTVCAFLNRDGGAIVLGVEDDSTIKRGVNPESVDQMCKDISNTSNNPQKLSPTFLLQPEVVDIDGKKVIVIQVPSSSQVHRLAGKIYDRSSDGDFELKTDAEISAMYQRKSTQYSENTIFPYLRLEHLSAATIEKAKNLIRNTRASHPWLSLSDMDFFKQANLYRYDFQTNQEGFTLAALMLFGKRESIQSALPYYKIDAVVRIHDIDRYDDRLTLDGNIIDDYDALMDFIAKHLPDNFFMEGDLRVSLRDKIYREVIANMLVHREYHNPTPTIIEIKHDGVIAKNANRPLKAGLVTLSNYSSHPKNPHIANFFVQIGRAEHLGTGIRNIYKYAPVYTGVTPIIEDEDVYIVKIGAHKKDMQKDIPNAFQTVPGAIQTDPDLSQKLPSLVITLIEKKPNISRAELAKQLNVSERQIRKHIDYFREKGILTREGGDNGKWIISAELIKALKSKL